MDHRAVWNRRESRIEMHLESKCAQRVAIPAARLDLHFAAGETIHTKDSYKFTSETIRDLLGGAGFEVQQTWTDGSGWYALTLARLP
jgi:L-histidine Nalpha-methyltransferase